MRIQVDHANVIGYCQTAAAGGAQKNNRIHIDRTGNDYYF